MIRVVILLTLCVAVLGLAVWGATSAAGNVATSATAWTLATTNAVSQTTVLVLACALIASLPLIVYGAFRLGAFIGERKRKDAERSERNALPRIIALPGLTADPMPGVGIGQPTLLLPAPRDASQSPTPVYPLGVPRVRRASRRKRHAAQIAQRWFR